MKKRDFLFQIPENAVFWLLLLSLTAGSAFSLYQKATGQAELTDSGQVLSPISVVSSQAAASSRSPLIRIPTSLSAVALTFDLAGETGSALPVLDALSASQTKATFFVSSDWVLSHPEELSLISSAGHEIGLTAGTGTNYRKVSDSELQKELAGLFDAVVSLTGQTPVYFRPPYKDPESPIAGAASRLGYTILSADCDSLDWKDYGADAIVKQVLETCSPEPGSVLEFRGNGKYTAAALPGVLSGLSGMGLSAGTVSSLTPAS